MKCIKRITLENFQSHRYSIIDFDEGLNVIVGPSDSGKSAIIRGIKWVLYNEPSGDYFLREGEKECSVTLEFSDNTTLKRYRSKTKNQYILIDNSGNEIKFEGFGSNIPEQIIETIGIKKIHLDSDESNSINIGEQLDGAFLLSEKTSTRASAIGRLVGVNIIDDALKDVLKDNRNLNITKRNLEDSIENLNEELKTYDYLKELKEKVKILSSIKNKIKEDREKLERLKELRKKINELRIETDYLAEVLSKLEFFTDLSNYVSELESKLVMYKYFVRYNTSLTKIKSNIEECNMIKNKLIGIYIIENNISNLENIYNKYNILIKVQKKIALSNYEINNINRILKQVKELDVLALNISKINDKLVTQKKLISYNETYNKIKNSLLKGHIYIDNLRNVDKISSIIDVIDEKLNLLNKLTNLCNLYMSINKMKKNEIICLSNSKININNKLREYQNLLKNIEVCPYCLSSIDEEKIDHIISHYIGG